MLIKIVVTLVVSCCVQSAEENRIVGGEKSPIHYPYQLSLQIPVSNSFRHFCGACIIDENFFLTAAHCVIKKNLTTISVLAGTANLLDENSGSRYSIATCKIHENYIPLNSSDIALCKVQTSFMFGENITKVKFDDVSVGANVTCLLTGWGSISAIRWMWLPFFTNLAYPNDLQRAYLPTISNDDCKARGQNVNETQICTFLQFMQGPCAGDSGGPLVGPTGTLVGLVSYGTKVCAIGFPDVYTRVSFFYSWINTNMALMSVASAANTVVQTIISGIPNPFSKFISNVESTSS